MSINFNLIDWKEVPKTVYPGKRGLAFWQVLQFGGLRIRIVEYSPGYMADHWCQKGHIVQCLQGSFVSELEDGEPVKLSEGMTYVVSDNMSSHRSTSELGVKLLIIDGTFLNGNS